MRWESVFLFLSATVLLFVGCSTQELSSDGEGGAHAPPVGQLRTRDHIVILHAAGPASTTYTVKRLDGEIVLEEASDQELQARLPKLHKQITESVAGDLWAGE